MIVEEAFMKRKCCWLILLGFVGLGLGSHLEAMFSSHREIQVAGRLGELAEFILDQGGNSVVYERGVTLITGRKDQLEESLYMALEVQAMQTEAHLQNVENYRTTGYKKKLVIYRPEQGPHVLEIHTQGRMQRTGNPFHVGIEGEGFFPVHLPDGGVAYTRAGDFRYDGRTDQVVTSSGFQVGVRIPSNYCNVQITPTGEVKAICNESIEGKPEVLGQFHLVTFRFPRKLRSIGCGLYESTPEAGELVQGIPGDGVLEMGALAQGHLETSNVNPVAEFENLRKSERDSILVGRCLKVLRPEVVTL
jgi:flagellar basal body rod protein FlgG